MNVYTNSAILKALTLPFVFFSVSAGQLKVVMEQVLEFAVSELTKIVEDSFDDLLLELTKVERENEALNGRLRASKQCHGDKSGNSAKSDVMPDVKLGVAAMKKEADNDSDSPGSSEGTRRDPPRGRERAAKVTRAKQQTSNESTTGGRYAMLSLWCFALMC